MQQTRWLTRAAWTTEPRPITRLTPMVDPAGLAVHWPGPTQAVIGDPGEDAIAARLESYRWYHTVIRGWTDIAYGAAIDQAGRIWDCRGLAYRPAANGARLINASHGAVLLLVGAQEEPTAAMLTAARWLIAAHWLAAYPRARSIVGHRDLHETDCPGPAIYRHVLAGDLLDPPHQEDPTMMILHIEDCREVFLIGGPRGIVHVRDPQELRRLAGLPTKTLSAEEAGYYFGDLPVPLTPLPS